MNKEKNIPVIRHALGSQWEKLHPTVRRHYNLSADDAAYLRLTGTMYEVDHAAIIKPFIWIAGLFGALVPYRGRDLPVEVINKVKQDGNTLYWQRHFHFPGKGPYRFTSRMETLKNNEIVEYVRYKLGIRMAMSVQNGALCYRSRGYLWKLGPLNVYIPDWLLLGEATIMERGIDDKTVELDFVIRHPLFGQTFTYSGCFTLHEE
jgi:hypothetical protein